MRAQRAIDVRVLSLFVLALLAGCGDPMMTLPGGALSGVATAVPPDWSSVADVKTIQVEFRPAGSVFAQHLVRRSRAGSLYRDEREGHALDAVRRDGSARARARRHGAV